MPRKSLSHGRDKARATIAAAYARFSSDRQRDESIEIQMEAIEKLVEREGWQLGPTYADKAKSGTNDRRPAFQRCIQAGEDGAYDVLVVYKQDRFARNVEDSKRNMRRLRKAGVRVVSVREGELEDTPDGFLRESIGEVFAEYYSRNLSVLVKDGMRKSAEDCRAVGNRLYGYVVDETDHFVICEDTAPYVAEAFRRYIDGQSTNQICAWLNSEGQRTLRGNKWGERTLARSLGDRSYMGTYHYCGVLVEGGMPAIVSRQTFEAVQQIRKRRQGMKRDKQVNDYILSDKCYCMDCGCAMCGTAGTSATGRKYTYYGCVNKGGCKKRVSSTKVEDAVISSVLAILRDDAAKDAIVADMVEWEKSQPRMADSWKRELAAERRRRDRLVDAVAEGMPFSSVREALDEAEERMAELEAMIAREEAESESLLDAEGARAFLDSFLHGAEDDADYRRLLAESFVDRVFVDAKSVIVVFNLGTAEPAPYSLVDIQKLRDSGEFASSELRGTKNDEPAGKLRVRTSDLWWALEDLNF